MNLSQKELEEYVTLMDFRFDFPERMTERDWDRYYELREKRFEGE